MLRDLGQRGLFQEREHGAYKGTVTTHPGIDGLAKTYERMRTRMDELMAAFDADGGAPAGLPDVMMEVLRQTEGVLEAALRPGSGEEGVERSRDSSGDEEPLAGRTSP